jgi:hypothetical protein
VLSRGASAGIVWREDLGEGMKQGSKRFFFEKKKQKTFIHWARAVPEVSIQMDKSFLVLFFKKEHSS